MAGAKYLTTISAVEPEVITPRFCFAYIMFFTALTLVMALFMTSEVKSFSPHGPYSSDTDKCSSCHRMHANNASKLLPLPAKTELCVSCHAKGQGADTAVMEGVYLDGQGISQGHTLGTTGSPLLGGGFNYVGGTQAVTGRHTLGVAGSPYGTGDGTVYTLTCMDCHTPHHNNNYRLLRRQPGGTNGDFAVAYNGPWTDASQTVQGGNYMAYTVTDFNPAVPGVQEYTRNYRDGIAAWCSACHQQYMTRGFPSTDIYNSGDIYGSTNRYRHPVGCVITGETDTVNGITYHLSTDLPLEDTAGNGRTADDRMTCLTCHQAHGSAARMTGSAVLDSGDRGSLPAGTNGIILRTDGRQLCVDCHMTVH